MITSIIFLTVFTVLFAAFNAYVISWAHTSMQPQRGFLSSIWHILGRVILAMVLFILWYYNGNSLLNLLFLFTVFNLTWTVWDVLINAIRMTNGEEVAIFQTDTKGINKYLFALFFNAPIAFWSFRFALIIINFILLIIK